MRTTMRIVVVLIALVISFLAYGDQGSLIRTEARIPATTFDRIKFLIVTVEEKGSQRKVIAESFLEGPPNTDFNINLDGERFRMRASFLTDLTAPDRLKIRARLNTRRLYGFSEKNLPLFEVDEQSQSLELGFDESVVLLPFGSTGGDHRLKIEITPSISEHSSVEPSGKARPLEINIIKPSPGGVLSVEAVKIPHNFVAEVSLLENGREIANGVAPLLIEEPQEIKLQSNREGDPNALTINLKVGKYTRSRPADNITFDFDAFQTTQPGSTHEWIAQKWAGVASLGSFLSYDLSNQNIGPKGKKYELRFKFNIAPGEQAD